MLNKTLNVGTNANCEKKNGYWYNNKCWANYAELDENISKANIDAEVEKQLMAIKEFGLTIDEKDFKIDFFFIETNDEDNNVVMITLFKDGNNTKTLLQIAEIEDLEKSKFTAQTILFDINLLEISEEKVSNMETYIVAKGISNIEAIEGDTVVFNIEGTLLTEIDGKESAFSMKVGEVLASIGNTTLEVRGTQAFLNGTLGTKGYSQFKDLIKNNPEVDTIVLQNVPGSINDAVNMHTGRIIREAGLNTKVLANSEISSGGVDLFCAGKERIVNKGARLGIHAWAGGGISADNLAKDHPAHQYQIAYFTMCLGKEKGPAFYFRTLEASSAQGMHWMSDKEIEQWNLSTQFLNK